MARRSPCRRMRNRRCRITPGALRASCGGARVAVDLKTTPIDFADDGPPLVRSASLDVFDKLEPHIEARKVGGNYPLNAFAALVREAASRNDQDNDAQICALYNLKLADRV